MDRKHDIELITKELNNPKITNAQRSKLKEQLNRIQFESYKVKSMREALIKAHREGNQEEINDIRDFVSRRNDYQS
jgi:hypothetical protein